MLMCGAVALVALGTYLAIGRPELPDAPYQQRLSRLIAALQGPHPPDLSPDEALAVWTHISRTRPSAAEPHLQVAGVLLRLGRFRESAIEFDKVLRLQPASAEALVGMGRALTFLEGRITPEALRYFQQAGERGGDPTPWMYQARASMEAGNDAEARRFWGEAARRMPADDPMRTVAEQMSHGAAP